jgi:hypothetical protein
MIFGISLTTGINMKRSNNVWYLLAFAGASLLADCGGGGGSVSASSQPPGMAEIGGSVTGLPAGITVLLVNNGSDNIAVNANGSFSFDTKVRAGASYNVTPYTQPTGASCSVSNATGTVDQNADAVTNVSVACQVAASGIGHYNVGVSVSGLSNGNTVTFMNNGADSLAVTSNGLAIFSQTYTLPAAGANPGGYSVTVAANPANQTCTLTNATGNVGAGNFANVTATCQ